MGNHSSTIEAQSPIDRPAEPGRDLFRNLVAGGGSSLVKAVLQLAMLPLMASLLGPHEFGLYATALPVVTFFTVIADGGLGTSLAKERSTDQTVWNTAFWVMLALGVVLALLVNLCGFYLAASMGEPRLRAIMSLLSISFLFIAVSVLPSARLYQRNDLVSLSAVETVATFIGAGFALFFAWHGYGAISLALQSVAAFGMRAIGLNVLAFQRPGRKTSLATLVDHMNTGGVLVGSRLVDMFSRFAENLLFSLAFGPAALGTYTFANQVCRFLCESASNPVWSATYAQALSVTGRPFNSLVSNMSRLMMLAVFPAACLAAVAAPDIFPKLLGAKWQHAGLYVQILVCAYALAAVSSTGSAALLATGHNRAFLATSMFLSASRVAAVAAAPWIGPSAAACAVAGALLAYSILMLIVVVRTFGLDKPQLLIGIGTPAAAGIATSLAYIAVSHALPATSVSAAAALAVGGLTCVATLCAIDQDFTIANLRGQFARVLARS